MNIIELELYLNVPAFIGYSSMLYYVQDCHFKTWEYRKRYLTIHELLTDLEINKEAMYNFINLNKLLLYIEFIYNMYMLSVYDSLFIADRETIDLLENNLSDLLEDLNYEIEQVDNKYIIVEKNPLTTAVAEFKSKVTSQVIEYRRFAMKGNIEAKKSILKVLADEIEPLRVKFKGTTYSSIIDDTFYLLNNLNIRHNNLEGKNKLEYVSNMSNEELEKWYDKIYDMILGIFVLEKYLNEKEEITKLKENLT